MFPYYPLSIGELEQGVGNNEAMFSTEVKEKLAIGNASPNAVPQVIVTANAGIEIAQWELPEWYVWANRLQEEALI